MALLSKAAPLSVSLETPPVPGSDRREGLRYLDWSYRGLLVADFGEYTVVGVHLKSPYDGRRSSYETRQAQVLGLLDFLGGLEGPVIVLGDFNDGPGRDARETEYGLSDAIGLLDGELARAVGPGVTQEDGLDIDQIFARGASIGRRTVLGTDWDVSDHRPVIARVEL